MDGRSSSIDRQLKTNDLSNWLCCPFPLHQTTASTSHRPQTVVTKKCHNYAMLRSLPAFFFHFAVIYVSPKTKHNLREGLADSP